MRLRPRRVAALVLLCGVAVAALPPTRWRAELVVHKLRGKLPDVSWRELARFLPPGSGMWLGDLVRTRNPFVSLTNPLTDDASVAAGQALFRTECSQCHGVRAEGGSGPSLATGTFRRGSSDWAIFRTITLGAPGTAMQPRRLPPRSVWQIVGYLRSEAALSRAAEDSLRAANGDGPGKVQALDVTYEQLVAAARDSADWPTYSGSYSSQRHSRLAEVDRKSISRLKLKWMFQFPKYVRYVESTPLVVGNTMYVTLPPNEVYALNAHTGEQLWSYAGSEPSNLRVTGNGGAVHRGVAVLGTTVFLGTSDAHLIALNAQTGRLLWDVKVAENKDGYFLTGAPLAIKDKIVLGVAGGEFGIRGFLDAYSPADGRRLWRFNTVPAPGEPGGESWSSVGAWKQGGAPTWLTGSYDPELDLLYWGVGNPSPDFDGDARAGRNLYSNCVIALEGATGRLRWYYQFTPHDEHDWDAAQIPVLADATFQNQHRKLMYWANRNGFYYVLDRVTGRFLRATAFAKQTWASGFDSLGAPIEVPGARPSREGTMTWPSMVGATNWWSPAYASSTNTFFVSTFDGPGLYFKSDQMYTSAGEFDASRAEAVPNQPVASSIRALNAETGALRWEYRFPPRARSYVMGGLLSTSGGLVFGGDQTGLVALDAGTGTELWRFNIGTWIAAAPITFLSHGRQAITLASGRAVLTFTLDGR